MRDVDEAGAAAVVVHPAAQLAGVGGDGVEAHGVRFGPVAGAGFVGVVLAPSRQKERAVRVGSAPAAGHLRVASSSWRSSFDPRRGVSDGGGVGHRVQGVGGSPRARLVRAGRDGGGSGLPERAPGERRGDAGGLRTGHRVDPRERRALRRRPFEGRPRRAERRGPPLRVALAEASGTTEKRMGQGLRRHLGALPRRGHRRPLDRPRPLGGDLRLDLSGRPVQVLPDRRVPPPPPPRSQSRHLFAARLPRPRHRRHVRAVGHLGALRSSTPPPRRRRLAHQTL
mmetsp:Transcript_12197/g.39911  ORF Transcript_12197/g.39911 Transcript_12197/m.39911 type:complete len:283 (-) Transcript_12197:268-1116(-)